MPEGVRAGIVLCLPVLDRSFYVGGRVFNLSSPERPLSERKQRPRYLLLESRFWCACEMGLRFDLHPDL
jgi:hypothetical protein